MQRFRYLTRQGNIVTSQDVDLILREDNCLLVVNRGSMINPKPSFARRELGMVIEKEQPVDVKDLPNLLFDYDYLPTYYIGFSKNYISKLQKNLKKITEDYENNKDSEEGMYNEFMRDLKKSRERWLIREANTERVRANFESNIKSNKLAYIDEQPKPSIKVDINEVIDKSFENDQKEIEPDYFDESAFVPVKKVKK